MPKDTIASNLIEKAIASLNESHVILNEIKATEAVITLDDEIGIQTLQLILQYRLDTQDSLRRLLQLQSSLWQILGINPQHSSTMNIERLMYALGSEDLDLALNMLNHLVEMLLRIIARLDKQGLKKTTVKNAPAITVITKPAHVRLNIAIEKQKTAVYALKQLTDYIEALGGEPQAGPIHDHIAALEGPISRFFQALQNGMVLSMGLYEQSMTHAKFDLQLQTLLQKNHEALTQITEPLAAARLFKAPLTAPQQTASSQNLEQRAAAKRLGHFFNHS